MEIEDGDDKFFNRLDVEAAIDNCNFNKAMENRLVLLKGH